ncbi:MAG: MBL fold metallo-hydrolase, partial [Steroidobacter sp.]
MKRSGAKRLGALAVCAICLISIDVIADSSVTKQRSVTRLTEGVFVIRHADAPDGYPQGNTTVIVGEREALVVDSGYLPSGAREDIAQIRQWTDKPVRYVLNTHWHPDHQRGNAAYVEAFPHLGVIAHRNTSTLMATYETGNLSRYPGRVAAMRTALDQGKDATGKSLDAAELQAMREQFAGQSRVLAELQASHMLLPTITFDRELDLDLGNRIVEIRHSGSGDTQGDAWAYLPKERILITGDVLAAPVPYFFAGYPSGLATTLRRLLELETM